MEWVEGQDLAARLEAAPLSVEDALGLGRGVAAALAAAHACGIVHRDVKPSNVLLQGMSPLAPKLVDLGVARMLGNAAQLTRSGRTS